MTYRISPQYLKHHLGLTLIIKEFLEFEMLTLVPYAKELIDFTMLNQYENSYLRKYYQAIDDNISSILSTQAKLWLKNQ